MRWTNAGGLAPSAGWGWGCRGCFYDPCPTTQVRFADKQGERRGGGSRLPPPHPPRLFCVASVCCGRVCEPPRRPGLACVSERTLSLTSSLNRPSWPRRSGRSPERYALGQGSPAGGQQDLRPPPPEVPAQSKGRGKGVARREVSFSKVITESQAYL